MNTRAGAVGRRLLAGCAGLALAATLAACGGGGDEADGSGVTVKGAYGKVTVEGEPKRVVALTVQAAEILVELGIQPKAVATSQKEIDQMYPWLDGVFTGKLDPELTPSGAADPEAIGAHEPDLIVGATWNIAEHVYKQLTDVAPTFPGLGAGNDDWDKVTVALGELTGNDGKKLVSNVDGTCEKARKKLPGLDGKKYQYVASEKGQFRFGNGSWMECFGLKAADNQDNDQNTDAAVSEEQIEQLDADVLAIWDPDGLKKDVEDDPRFKDLPANTTGALLWVDLPLASATNSPGPLSFDYFIERLLPELESAGKD
ncbi:ABC transporter substrate-binding protein [Stackebrandtia nassauensis]|uniref:Periplasmic binding protein n=1 Tax=Stackebrandtia nassauensis (strain DSM 44728 / CIP 108903 / NRRL B-16338 / NBRC 102104 / LLR-40K-21) TaxID=446470 RepID=D3Q7F4_STANL|nr:ABC transporter substrate-binding protein [Stackebrandtia nassauensis]ADD42425.1 periplasmic binding protein [Stackebrandtia nassauensis DSM 44728]